MSLFNEDAYELAFQDHPSDLMHPRQNYTPEGVPFQYAMTSTSQQASQPQEWLDPYEYPELQDTFHQQNTHGETLPYQQTNARLTNILPSPGPGVLVNLGPVHQQIGFPSTAFHNSRQSFRGNSSVQPYERLMSPNPATQIATMAPEPLRPAPLQNVGDPRPEVRHYCGTSTISAVVLHSSQASLNIMQAAYVEGLAWELQPFYQVLTQEADPAGFVTEYEEQTPHGFGGPGDKTSFIFGQAGLSYDHWPKFMYILDPPPEFLAYLVGLKSRIKPKLDRHGNEVKERWPEPGKTARSLLDYPGLPDQISTLAEWWRLELWRRLTGCNWADVLMRMMPENGHRVAGGEARKRNCLNMEGSRTWNPRYNLASWFNRTKTYGVVRQELLAKLSSWHIEQNSTRGLTPGLVRPEHGDVLGNRIVVPQPSSRCGKRFPGGRKQNRLMKREDAKKTKHTAKKTRHRVKEEKSSATLIPLLPAPPRSHSYGLRERSGLPRHLQPRPAIRSPFVKQEKQTHALTEPGPSCYTSAVSHNNKQAQSMPAYAVLAPPSSPTYFFSDNFTQSPEDFRASIQSYEDMRFTQAKAAENHSSTQSSLPTDSEFELRPANLYRTPHLSATVGNISSSHPYASYGQPIRMSTGYQFGADSTGFELL